MCPRPGILCQGRQRGLQRVKCVHSDLVPGRPASLAACALSARHLVPGLAVFYVRPGIFCQGLQCVSSARHLVPGLGDRKNAHTRGRDRKNAHTPEIPHNPPGTPNSNVVGRTCVVGLQGRGLLKPLHDVCQVLTSYSCMTPAEFLTVAITAHN